MKRYSDKIIEQGTDSCRVYALPTAAPGIVTFRGSLLTLPDLRADQDLVQDVVASVLDKGTRGRDQFEIAELLDNLGAQISFYSSGLRVGFRGKCLSKDIEPVMTLVAEQLREPALEDVEVEKARTRLIASAQRSLESTSDQASSALSREIFPSDHPNYSMAPADVISFFESVDGEQSRRFHDVHFGSRTLNTVFVGDVDSDALNEIVPALFNDWDVDDRQEMFSAGHRAPSGGLSFVSMPDKPNAHVSLGHGLDIRREDPRFVPLYIANYVLGGNFSARLMSRVRDELGLTYGIHSSIADVTPEYDGLWEVGVTLSTENLEDGIEATRSELQRFVDDGITEEELDEKKTTITGSFLVGLATTGGLARALLGNVERRLGVDYLDRFPKEVMACTLDDANEAVRQLLRPNKLHVAVAGARSPELIPESE
ncbi:MAG: insulinase family protein [Rhodothermia bacterium]|nr:insulinase family protein [Rhodothermia bacterium]